MSNVFAVLVPLSLVALFVGLVRPRWIGMSSRKRAALICGGAFIVFFILFAVTTPPTPAPAPAPTQAVETNSGQSVQPQPQNTPGPDAQLKSIVANVLAGQTNMSHEDKLRNVDVVPQIDGGWGVFVEFNGDDNLTPNLTKQGIEKQMSDIYIALYTSGLDVRSASAAAFLKLTDKYGNTSDVMVYKSLLGQDVAGKVNWQTDKATLELQILPGLWSTTILSPTLTN